MTRPAYRAFSFFGGKGGTGKTTCAAARALALAEEGIRTLVVSTDPAHSLADAFDLPIGDEISLISPNLWAIEIDAEVEAQKYMKGIQEKMLHIVSPVIVDEIKRQIEIAYSSPGAEEAAIFDKFIELMEHLGDPYEAIVFDTAPTGHTLRLLTLPEILGAWLDHLLEKRARAVELMSMVAKYDRDVRQKLETDPITDILGKRKEKFEMARSILTDPEESAFYFVLNAEKLPILETQRAIRLLRKYGIPIGGVLVNRVIPEGAGTFMEQHRLSQQAYLKTIHETFMDLPITEIPFLDTDIRGMSELNKITKLLKNL
ncbi:MAG: ArsA family ATPase [Synergistales bacterium]|jgi:arsenite-transporting ATPase